MNRKDSLSNFIEFCKCILPASPAQRMQDLWALWESGFSTNGYFVEFGALNGKDVSNTYLLEQIGWNGVVAEPHPSYEKILKEHRSCYVSTKCVYTETGQTVKFRAVLGKPALSSIVDLEVSDLHEERGLRQRYNEVSVETISLHDLLIEASAPKVIDFLSIDTEGSELLILEAFDFDSFLINCICVEHNETSRQCLFDLLVSKGYERKWEVLSGHDDWYVRRDSYENKFYFSTNEIVQKIPDLKFERNLDKRFALLDQVNKRTKVMDSKRSIESLNGTIVQSIIENQTIYFFVSHDDDPIQRHHFKGEFYEAKELNLLKNFVPKDSIILDIGSNVGNHTIFFEKFLNPKSIIVIEPNPITIRTLKINLTLNNCKMVNQEYLGIGLSDKTSRANMGGSGRRNLGSARLLLNEEGDIPVKCGDSLFWKQNVDFIKVDVEELEMEVLYGLELTVQSSRPLIFIEVFSKNMILFKQWMSENSYTFLERYKYRQVRENCLIAPKEHTSFYRELQADQT